MHERDERDVGELGAGGPRVVLFEEQRLASVDVSDATRHSLIEQQFAERVPARGGVGPGQKLINVERFDENVRPETAQGATTPGRSGDGELDDRYVETHSDPVACLDDEARLA